MNKKLKGGTMTINEQINLVVEAREKAKEALDKRMAAYGTWLLSTEQLFADEKAAKETCAEAEKQLREMALEVYAETKDKAVAPGIGIRVMTKMEYDAKVAMEWAVKHELALKLDTGAFEKIAKTNALPFVIIFEEPLATIAQELVKVEL